MVCSIILGIGSMMMVSCKHADLTTPVKNEVLRPASDFLKNNYDFSLFYAALEYTGLTDTLNEKGPFTLLAPENRAFNEIGIRYPQDFKGLNKDSLGQVMRYHILPRRLIESEIPVNGVDVRYMTLAGIELYASYASFNPGNEAYPVNKLFFSGCRAYKKDVPLANGVLHVLNKVMKPYPGKTVQQLLASRPDYSIFVSGLKKFGLWDELAGEGPFTIFAPNNKAFQDEGFTQQDIDKLDAAKYVGARLFGSYIIYKKRYFITDQIVFAVINAESRFEAYVRNDLSQFSFMVYEDGGIYPNVRHYPVISWGSPKDPKVVYDPNQIIVQYWGDHKDMALSDHLCDNGILHDLKKMLVNPELALKK